LRRAQLIADIRAAADRGVVFAGMSAGAIMLGERWIRWPHADAGDAEAETYECLGLAPCALDCHGEADGWTEARSFVAVRARELKRKAKVYGIPSGGALIAERGGKMRARGESVPVFAAPPRGTAAIERMLPAEKT
jgi:peptidase E